MFFLSATLSSAQQMEVQDFSKYRPAQPRSGIERSKDGAIIDFLTSESGFEFLADGKASLDAEEGDGSVRIIVPRKTRYLSIKHLDYGECIWKLPVKAGRFKHYSAYLATYSPDKLYKLSKQWLVLDITPDESLVRVDSTLTLVRNGKAQFHLPLGPHKYVVEAPFHTTVSDTLSLSDTGRVCRKVALQPFYSYITVRPGSGNPEIYLDREFIGKGEATSGRLAPGSHRITVIWDNLYYYDSDIELGPAEKRTVSLSRESDAKSFWYSRRWSLTAAQRAAESGDEDPLQLLADAIPEESGGGVPADADRAWLSIHSNVTDALIYIDDSPRGLTPCILEKVPGHTECTITLCKAGYRNVSVNVTPHSNDLTDVNIKMEKLKKGR